MTSENDQPVGLFSPALPGAGWIVAHCDGGSRGNPGPAGFGVYVQDEAGATLAELSEYIGLKTNNVAEYSGLLAALQYALDQGFRRLRVISDSELMVKQIKGQYRVNSPDLKPLYDEAKRRIARLETFRIEHVLRGKNQKADELANLAMDRGSARSRQPERAPRETSPAKEPETARATSTAPHAGELRGFVKGGVVHLLDGARLPDGTFVKVMRES